VKIVVLAGKLHPYGGVETHLFNYCLTMPAMADITLVITSRDYRLESKELLTSKGVTIVEFDCRGRLLGLIGYLKCLLWLALQKRYKCVLYSNGTSGFAYAAQFALMPALWIHHHHSDVTKAICDRFTSLYKRVLQRADRVIACTPGHAALIDVLFHRNGRTIFLPYLKSESDCNETFGRQFNREGMIIGFFGRLRESKGVKTLIALAPWFAEERMHCLLHGDNCEHLVPSALPNGISWTGPYDSSRDLDRLFRNVDAVVLPTSFAEGLPIVMTEAISRGVPVVAYPAGGLREMTQFHPGLLIVEPDPESLKAGLLEMRDRLGDPNMKRTLVQKYREELSNHTTILWWTRQLDGVRH
jgi:glycosyltransferase involved in cell wall biosynthesis